MRNRRPDSQIDRAEELQREWDSATGQIWQLGDHRLMCGDSTKPDNVASLLEGAVPPLMVTDPPYGDSYDPTWREGADLGIGKRSKGKVLNDDRVDWTEAYLLF